MDGRKIVLAKELTKIHESYIRGTASELIEKIKEPKGEFVIVIEGNKKKEENNFSNISIKEHYEVYSNLGYEKKEIIKRIAKDRGVNKNEIYKMFLDK